MNVELPLYPQEKPNTCALACLRMVLSAFGIQVAEATIEAEARMEERGTLITELERLARHFQLAAEIQDTTVEDLHKILGEGKLPIVFLDRAVFDLTPQQRRRHSIRDAIIHTVIPTRVTANSVTFHDPRDPTSLGKQFATSVRLTWDSEVAAWCARNRIDPPNHLAAAAQSRLVSPQRCDARIPGSPGLQPRCRLRLDSQLQFAIGLRDTDWHCQTHNVRGKGGDGFAVTCTECHNKDISTIIRTHGYLFL